MSNSEKEEDKSWFAVGVSHKVGSLNRKIIKPILKGIIVRVRALAEMENISFEARLVT